MKISDIRNIKFNILQSVVLMLALSLLLVLCQCMVQSAGAVSMIAIPFLLILNALPLFAVMCVIYSLTNRVWAGFLGAALPFYILLTVNYFKVYFRSETLSVHDFSLATEAANIMTGYKFPVPYALIFTALIIAAAFVFLLRYIRQNNGERKKRLLLLGITVVVSIGAYFGFYSDLSLYKKLPSFANQYNDVSVAEHKGFLFTFLTHTSSYDYKRPDGYDIHSVPQLGSNAPDTVSAQKPPINVIAIMSEAFFDMEACENIEFNDGLSPTPNFNRLKDSSLWGHTLVPGYAGSTASTEFEFLTGVNISHIDSAMPVVYKTHVTQNTYSLAQMFADMGYTTEALHPGNAWFYNRKAVYPRLGFQKAYFIDDFEHTAKDLVNYYLSDDAAADKIISEYENYLSSQKDNGYFSFTVTIQNHGPYSQNEPDIKRIKNNGNIDENGYRLLSNYANGLHDADALLGKVCDYAETVDKPTVVVFFGDHLPYFDAEGRYLDAIGLDVNSNTPEALENRYSTPYIMHGNAAFNSLFGENAPENGRTEHISSSFLGARMLQYMGIEPSPYFKAVNEISKTIQEISGSFYIADGEHTTTLTASQEQVLKNYEYLSYWALRGYGGRE